MVIFPQAQPFYIISNEGQYITMLDLQCSTYYSIATPNESEEFKILKASIKRPRGLNFLKLPLEVLHIIYWSAATWNFCSYAILRNLRAAETDWVTMLVGERLELWSLIRTCRTIHREAIGYLYRYTHFPLDPAPGIFGKLPGVMPGLMVRCELIFHVGQGWDQEFETIMDWLHWGEHLDILGIKIHWPREHKPGTMENELRAVLLMWRNIRFTRRVVAAYFEMEQRRLLIDADEARLDSMYPEDEQEGESDCSALL